MKKLLFYIFCFTYICQSNAHQVFFNPNSSSKSSSSGGGGFADYRSYEKEGYVEKEWYKFEPERFPILVCIDPVLSARKQKIIASAIHYWNNLYQDYAYSLIDEGVLFRSDIGKHIPKTSLLKPQLCNTKGAFWYRFIFIHEKRIEQRIFGDTTAHAITYFWIRFGLDYIEVTMNKNIHFNLSQSPKYDNGIYYKTVMYHELGHALGLVHSNNTSYPLMNWNAWFCRGRICNPSRRDIRDFLDLYIDWE